MTTAERYILMGNLSMKEGKIEQAIINYRCAVLAGDSGQKSFALCRVAKCYAMLEQFEKTVEIAEKMISKFGEELISKSLLEICAEASLKLGDEEAFNDYQNKVALLVNKK